MSMTCTRCGGTGFLNDEQIPSEFIFDNLESILIWIKKTDGHDVQVCDCCGDGENWYGVPGEHYNTNQDPAGPNGPYTYNGGLCECH